MELSLTIDTESSPVKSEQEEINFIRKEALYDPVFFCRYFLSHLFGGDLQSRKLAPVLARHQQGCLAIFAGKTEFLWRYGSVSWLIENFYRSNSKIINQETEKPVNQGSIFRIFHRKSGKELSLEQVRYFESNYSPEDLAKALNIKILRGDIGNLFIIPRGFAKTTTIGIAGSLYIICYKLHEFIVYLSESSPHACMQAENIKGEIESNLRVKRVFGILAPIRADSERWSSQFFECMNGVAFMPKGRGGQVRGLLHKGHRPSCVIFDDLEDKESVKSIEQRRKALRWFYSDVLPMLPKRQFVKNCMVLGLGTMLARECLIESLAADQAFTAVRLANRDFNGEPLWPEAEDENTINREKSSYARQGLLQDYYLEKENRYVQSAGQRFKKEYFQYEVVAPDRIEAYVIYCDPALGKSRVADRCIIQVGGIMKDGRIYIATEWAVRHHLDAVKAMCEQYFIFCKLFNIEADGHGFEANAYQASIHNILTLMMPKENYYFEPQPIINSKKKNERIGGTLQPRCSSGYMLWHPSFEGSETIDEALQWNPEADDQNDDGIDCATGIINLLERQHMYAAKKDPVDDEVEEYGDIIDVEFQGNEWRSAV